MSDADITRILIDAEASLSAAGVDSASADAAALLAHAWGRDLRGLNRARLMGDTVPAAVVDDHRALVERRASRIPLQHLTGQAHFRTLTLPVGPGVFIPRPETELLVDPVLEHLNRTHPSGGAHVLDLCAGSGALGLSVAVEAPGTSVVGIEADPTALVWQRRSAAQTHTLLSDAGSAFHSVEADATHSAAVTAAASKHLSGRVDAIVSNPPYVVNDGTTTAPEVVDHDPALALWGGGDDGTDVPRRIIAIAARTLTGGGLLVLEHADTQGAQLRETAHAAGFAQVHTRPDYTGRDRFTVAVRQLHTHGK